MKLLSLAALLLLPHASPCAGAPAARVRGIAPVSSDGVAAPRLPETRLKEDSAQPEGDLIVSFKGFDGAIERAGKFRVAAGSQANYVAGGDTPRELENKFGTGVEFKKHAFVLNLVATADGKGGASGELQLEISGVQRPDPASKLHVPPLSTFQLQTRFHAVLGKPLVLVDEPGRRFELTLEPAP